MIRERTQVSLAYVAGQPTRSELSKDAVYHQIQLVFVGTLTSVNAAGSSANTFSQNFPFNIMRNVILRRNGSDVVYQAPGEMIAKENLYMNGNSPRARLTDVNGAIYLKTTNGISIPANSAGINDASAEFTDAGTASTTVVTNFDCQVEIWLQLGVEDRYAATLIDARPLSSFVLEVQWANPTDIIIQGTNVTSLTLAGNLQVNSYDQDNVTANQPFGTFKRSVQAIQNAQFSSNNQQFLLTRGNFYYGILFQTQTFKAGSTLIPRQEQAVISNVTNRVNTNYYLRVTDFITMQFKNKADEITEGLSYQAQSGSPRGFAHLYFPMTGDRLAELVPSFSMDTYDLLLTLGAGTENGAPTGGTLPVINMLVQEVIPGQSIAPNMPPAAFAGSVRRTQAQPYRG